KSPWQQVLRVWQIIGFIASFIIHSKINNFPKGYRFITRLYVKRATHNSRKMIKNGSQIYFRIFGADMGVRSVSTSVVAILIRPLSRPYLGKDCWIHERLEMCFLKLKCPQLCTDS